MACMVLIIKLLVVFALCEGIQPIHLISFIWQALVRPRVGDAVAHFLSVALVPPTSSTASATSPSSNDTSERLEYRFVRLETCRHLGIGDPGVGV